MPPHDPDRARRHTLMPCVVINEEEKELSEGQ